MASLVKKIKPPFYIAIINDNKNPETFDGEISPTDKMISIALHQSGFLGLETTRNKKGKWVTISYWSDMDAEKAWEQKGDNQIRKHFDGIALKEFCTISVSKINHKIKSINKLYTSKWVIPKSIISSFAGVLIIGSFSIILHMLGHKTVH
jgi:heme-degrading monooxygenase HmoA